MSVRKIPAIIMGLAAFAAIGLIASRAAVASWPAYALASPARAYTLDMLFVRLTVGAFGAFVGGAVAARVADREQQAPLWFGVALLFLSAIQHYLIWDQYPVWYHLSWFACIVPSAILGGKLVERGALMTSNRC